MILHIVDPHPRPPLKSRGGFHSKNQGRGRTLTVANLGSLALVVVGRGLHAIFGVVDRVIGR